MADTDWSRLEDAYGQATSVPDLLGKLERCPAGELDDALGELGTRLWHQGTIYSASPVVLPLLLDIALTAKAPNAAAALLLFVSIASGDPANGMVEERTQQTLTALAPRLSSFRRPRPSAVIGELLQMAERLATHPSQRAMDLDAISARTQTMIDRAAAVEDRAARKSPEALARRIAACRFGTKIDELNTKLVIEELLAADQFEAALGLISRIAIHGILVAPARIVALARLRDATAIRVAFDFTRAWLQPATSTECPSQVLLKADVLRALDAVDGLCSDGERSTWRELRDAVRAAEPQVFIADGAFS